MFYILSIRQINSVAVLSIVPHNKDKQLLVTYLEAFALATLPNVVAAAEGGHKLPNEQILSGINYMVKRIF